MQKNFFDPHQEKKGAYRSAEVFARCQLCEQAANTYCGHCGHTLCDAHAPENELCPECHERFTSELNRKQGRFWEGMGIVFLSLALLGLGGGASALLFGLDSILAKIVGGVLLMGVGLAPIWLLLGREWIARKVFRRIR